MESKKQIFCFFILFLVIFNKTYSQETNTYYSIKNTYSFFSCSIPIDETRFPESQFTDSLISNYNHAKTSHYTIDPRFYRSSSPVSEEIQSNHLNREIYMHELYDLSHLSFIYSAISLNLAYYPNQRAAYNFDVFETDYSKGIDSTGYLFAPETRWGGIQSRLLWDVFQMEGMNYIGFWLMDPFIYNPDHEGGKFFINIGEISEDINKDGMMTSEHCISNSYYAESDTTAFGVIWNYNNFPNHPYFFDNYDYQDVGLDGLDDIDERNFYNNYINDISYKFQGVSTAWHNALNDPSGDNFISSLDTYFDDIGADINLRYKNGNNYDGNTRTDYSSSNWSSGKNFPDYEDINKNRVLDSVNNYCEIELNISPDELEVGKNYITEKKTVNPTNGDGTPVDFYKFLIPLNSPDWTIFGSGTGEIKSNFIRLYLTEFKDSIILRFPEIAFVNNDLNYYTELSNSKEVSLYPNPCRSEAVRVRTPNESISSVKVYNSTGQCILTNDSSYINIENLSSGQYIVEIKTYQNLYYKKFTVIKAQ
jgi:cell surface protein SprA